ncbi:hypothetical protein DPD44_22555 [Salmonella enterica subsp. enterica serovar Poona]|nr:hypothetical protein [Salmonella enterica subsp. enterica serovar Poona]
MGASVNGNNATVVGNKSFANGDNSTVIGLGAHSNGKSGTSLGQGARVNAEGGTATGQEESVDGNNGTSNGHGAAATGVNSVALGAKSKAEHDNEVNIGIWKLKDDYTAYEQVGTRSLGGLAEGVNADDAVNKGQLDTAKAAAICHSDENLAAAKGYTNTEIGKV